jgi:hypothetical protein
MANYRFRGPDFRAAPAGEVPVDLDRVDPPLELAQLLALRHLSATANPGTATAAR